MRKKLSEMTPYERVDKRLKGLTWEEAEDVGVEILARVMALHIYSRNDGVEHFEKMTERIIKRAGEWAKEPGIPTVLALAAADNNREKNEREKEYEE